MWFGDGVVLGAAVSQPRGARSGVLVMMEGGGIACTGVQATVQVGAANAHLRGVTPTRHAVVVLVTGSRQDVERG
jgi:hypothetical protein